MKKIITILFFLLAINLSSSFAKIQKDNLNSPPEKNNILNPATKTKKTFVGGDIGVTFGDYTEVRISPLIGYRFSQEIAAGLKFVYAHSWDQSDQNSLNTSTIQSNSYGGNIFFNYYPLKELYFKLEFSDLSYDNIGLQESSRNWVPFLFVGAEYTKGLSQNVNFNIGIKVDVLNNDNSPFTDYTPFFDIGITAGI